MNYVMFMEIELLIILTLTEVENPVSRKLKNSYRARTVVQISRTVATTKLSYLLMLSLHISISYTVHAMEILSGISASI
jgi:hypothetical protein